MKKALFTFLGLTIATLTFLKFFLPNFSKAQVPTAINVAEYVASPPDNSAVAINSAGEKFSTHCIGNDCTLCKDDSCSGFEKRFILDDGIGLQGENWWVGTNTTFRYERADGSLAPWLPSTMSVGETYHSGPFIVQGYRIDGNNYIPYPDAPHSGPTGGVSMKLESVGPVKFNGLTLPDVAVIRVVDGPGAGEAFYFAKGIGQVGWGPNIPVEILNLPPEQMKEIIEGLIREIEMKLPERSKATCSTTQQAMQPTPLRPFPCEACSDSLGPQTESCATPFQVYTRGKWCLTPPECDADYSETYNWGGTVVVDFTETKVPFAGYGNSPDTEIDTEISPAASKYLADYFTGTLFYGGNGQQIDTSDPLKYSQELFRKAGVFRKLAPQELQDELKNQMIDRAQKSQAGQEFYPVSNYKVRNHDQKNNPQCETKTLMDFYNQGAKKPLRQDFKKFNDYLAAVRTWEEKDSGCWAVLWPAVPMFSQEDAPGQIFITAHPPGQLSPSQYRATFPHLARLYESSDKLHELLTPIITTKMAEKAEVPEKIEVETCATKSGGKGVKSAIGCIPVEARDIASWVLKYASSLGGGIAFTLMGYAAFLVITASGDLEKIAQAKQILTAAIIGLLVIIFTTFILQLITAKILKIPGFSKERTIPGVQQARRATPGVILAAKDTPEVTWNGSSGMEEKVKTLLASTLLAQGETEPQYPLWLDFSAGLRPTDDPSVKQVTWAISPQNKEGVDGSDWGYQILVNGQPVFQEGFLPGQTFSSHPTITQDMGSAGASPVFIPVQAGTVEISVQITNLNHTVPGEFGDPRNFLKANQVCTVDAQGNVTGCGTGEPVIGPPPPSDICQSPDSKKSCSYPNAIMDANKNDPICVSGSENGIVNASLTVNNYKAKISSGAVRALAREYEKCLAEGRDDCDPCSTVKLSRWISIRTLIPWLEKIWDRTTNLPEDLTDLSKSGLFHIFTPANMTPFEPEKAKTPIAEYAFKNIRVDKPGGGGGASPKSGWLYYPFLGGIQQAKKCISEQFLLPRELQLNQNLCPPILAGKSIYDMTREEMLENQLCTTLNYEIDYRNAGIDVEKNKDAVIAKVQSSWNQTMLNDQTWNHVVEAAQNHGWNPAFVLALWIEETGASHFVQAGISQDAFGCNPTVAKTLDESLDCLFSREYANQPFKEFMLTYSEGPSHPDEQFCLNPNFPGNIQAWYNQLIN